MITRDRVQARPGNTVQLWKMMQFITHTYVQAHLGEVTGLVPGHHNKANTTINQVT